jgi:hypothetical protein
VALTSVSTSAPYSKRETEVISLSASELALSSSTAPSGPRTGASSARSRLATPARTWPGGRRRLKLSTPLRSLGRPAAAQAVPCRISPGNPAMVSPLSAPCVNHAEGEFSPRIDTNEYSWPSRRCLLRLCSMTWAALNPPQRPSRYRNLHFRRRARAAELARVTFDTSNYLTTTPTCTTSSPASGASPGIRSGIRYRVISTPIRRFGPIFRASGNPRSTSANAVGLRRPPDRYGAVRFVAQGRSVVGAIVDGIACASTDVVDCLVAIMSHGRLSRRRSVIARTVRK